MAEGAGARIPDRILLVGLMASGKSTIGRELARRLQREYFDNDTMLQETSGMSLAELATRGLGALHAAEAATFARLLDRAGPWVASAAASIVLDPAGTAALQRSGVCSVWLRASPATLARRVAGSTGDRPIIAQDPYAAFSAMADERNDSFRQLAGIVVDVDEGSVTDIADTIMDRLRTRGADPGG